MTPRRFGILLALVNARFDGLRNEMNARFEAVNAKFDAVDAKFEAQYQALLRVDARLKHLEDRER